MCRVMTDLQHLFGNDSRKLSRSASLRNQRIFGPTKAISWQWLLIDRIEMSE